MSRYYVLTPRDAAAIRETVAVYRTAAQAEAAVETLEAPHTVAGTDVLPDWADAVVEADGSARRLLRARALTDAAAQGGLVDVRIADPSAADRGRLSVAADGAIRCTSVNGTWTLGPTDEVVEADLDTEPDHTRAPSRPRGADAADVEPPAGQAALQRWLFDRARTARRARDGAPAETDTRGVRD